MPLQVRPARQGDTAVIRELILALAEYERLASRVRTSEADVRALLFGDHPKAFCEIAEVDGTAVGFALWFYNLSTFEGRHGIYLEDLFVRPEVRGRGVGLALMRALARRCAAEGLARIDWAVLDWNADALAFYDRLGAETMSDWVPRRLSGEALAKLAAG